MMLGPALPISGVSYSKGIATSSTKASVMSRDAENARHDFIHSFSNGATSDWPEDSDSLGEMGEALSLCSESNESEWFRSGCIGRLVRESIAVLCA